MRVPAKAGYYLLVDQCAGCGGVWCDRWELYALSSVAVQALEDADPHALLAAASADDERLHCPRCQVDLERFKDPTLPADAELQRCARCEGLWLHCGTMRRLKRPDRKPRPALAPSGLPPHEIATVRRLDDATRQSLDPPADAEIGPELVASTALVALRLLIRWLTGL
jgi:Zn-finger nucleic acid-binding protein